MLFLKGFYVFLVFYPGFKFKAQQAQ